MKDTKLGRNRGSSGSAKTDRSTLGSACVVCKSVKGDACTVAHDFWHYAWAPGRGGQPGSAAVLWHEGTHLRAVGGAGAVRQQVQEGAGPARVANHEHAHVQRGAPLTRSLCGHTPIHMQAGLLKPLGALALSGHSLGNASDGMFTDTFSSPCITQLSWLCCTRCGETHTCLHPEVCLPCLPQGEQASTKKLLFAQEAMRAHSQSTAVLCRAAA